MGRLRELQERRAYECRLSPDRALETLDDAEAFLLDRGMLTRRLPRIARDQRIRLLEIHPTDESLESVFSYLVGR